MSRRVSTLGARPRRPRASPEQVRRSRERITRIGQVSDGLVRVGPFRLGLEGLLTWAPGLGEAYSLGAGGLLFAEGVKAGAPPTALAKVAALVLGRTLLSGVGETPIVGALAKLTVDGFRAHKLAADILLRATDGGEEGAAPPVKAGRPRRR